MIGAFEFAKMKEGAVFINGSRGRIVEQAALIHALHTGRLGAVGLDVFENENSFCSSILALSWGSVNQIDDGNSLP
jgi:phosphoglycerate dehydrogenase-like enzyme